MAHRLASSFAPKVDPSSSLLPQQSKFSCGICSQRFAHILGLKNHIYQEHPNMDAFPFTCNICGQGFFTKQTLKQHSQKHSAGFECPICSRKFGYTRSLIRHQEMDHQVRKCRYCKRFFKIGPELDQHLLTCTDKYKFASQ